MRLLGGPAGILGQPYGCQLWTFPGGYAQKIRSIFGSSLKSHWPLNEAAGPAAHNRVNQSGSSEIISNGGFENTGAGGADLFYLWSETASDGVIAAETLLVHSGIRAAKLTAGAGADTRLLQNPIPVMPGKEVTFSLWTRGDGTNAGRYAIYDEQNAAWIKALGSTGVTGTTYSEVSFNFTVPAGCCQVRVYLYCPSVNGGSTYFDDVSLSGQASLNGIFSPSGITYGEPGIGDGLSATRYSGASSYVSVGNDLLASLWNGNQGSAIAWGKVDGSARWTDASEFRYLFHPKSATDQTVYLVMGKHTDNHTLFWRRRVTSGIYEKKYVFSPSGTLDWFCMGMTWDMTSTPKVIRCYLYADGAWQKVSDEEPLLGYETWDNGMYPVSNGNFVIMAGGVPAQEWIGWGAHVAFGAGLLLSDAQMQAVMAV